MGMGQNWVPLKWVVNTKNRLITFFQWSPSTEIPSDTSILTFYLAFYLTHIYIYVYIFWQSIWHLFWHSMWYSIWHIFWQSIWHKFWHSICLFGDSLWSRFGRDHFDPEVAVRVRHCDQERRGPLCGSWGLAAEEEREKEKEEEEEGHKT